MEAFKSTVPLNLLLIDRQDMDGAAGKAGAAACTVITCSKVPLLYRDECNRLRDSILGTQVQPILNSTTLTNYKV
jgi:hypothetical protein